VLVLAVEQEEFSWAYSIESFMFTVALCILPYIFGELRSWSGSYRLPMLFLAGLNCIALVVIVVLYVVDRRRGQALRRPGTGISNTACQHPPTYILTMMLVALHSCQCSC